MIHDSMKELIVVKSDKKIVQVVISEFVIKFSVKLIYLLCLPNSIIFIGVCILPGLFNLGTQSFLTQGAQYVISIIITLFIPL